MYIDFTDDKSFFKNNTGELNVCFVFILVTDLLVKQLN